MLVRLKKWINKKLNRVTIKEYYEEVKHFNKRELIKEVIVLSQKINHNQCGVSSDFKKGLRKCSKKQLLRTLIVLQLEGNRGVKKLRKKFKHLKPKELTMQEGQEYEYKH